MVGAGRDPPLRREATLAGHAGLGLGAGALLITLTALGYVFQLTAASPACVRWTCGRCRPAWRSRNLLVAGPLSAVPIAGLAMLAGRDPTVLLLGLPVFLLYALKLTARPVCAARRNRPPPGGNQTRP